MQMSSYCYYYFLELSVFLYLEFSDPNLLMHSVSDTYGPPEVILVVNFEI